MTKRAVKTKVVDLDSPVELPITFLDSELYDLAHKLTDIGFIGAIDYLAKQDPGRVKAAYDHAITLPKRGIWSLAGLVRYIVKTPGEIPKPLGSNDSDKYVKGKYGHLVNR